MEGANSIKGIVSLLKVIEILARRSTGPGALKLIQKALVPAFALLERSRQPTLAAQNREIDSYCLPLVSFL
jgi:hypothetical protein